MKSYLLRKKIFTVIFLIVVIGYSGVNGYHGCGEWWEEVKEEYEQKSGIAELISELDAEIIDSMYQKMNFIEVYSYIQVLMDKREFNNFTYIKDENGYLHYAAFFKEEDTKIAEYAKRVKRLQDKVEQNGTKVLFMVTPGKYIVGESEFLEGMPVNNPDSTVDELLFYLNRFGVESIDLRKYLPNDTLPYEDTFFKTDHHWTIPASFQTAQIIVDTIEEKYGEELDPDNYYMNPENYEAVTYKHGMIGSMGRKTGANFSGLEDFVALWPKFKTYYTRESIETSGDHRIVSGTAENTVLYPGILRKGSNIYSDSQYSFYMNGINPYEKVVNKDNPDGCSIFAVRDSYFSPVMTFLLPMCSEMTAIWSLQELEELDIQTYVSENVFDYIIIEIYPYNIYEDAFNFFEEE